MTVLSTTLAGLAFLALLLSPLPVLAQPSGAELYARACAQCHDSRDTEIRAPRLEVMRTMTPEAILRALESGSMKPFAQELSAAERAALAQHIAGRAFSQQAAAVTSAPGGRCTEGGRDVVRPMEGPGWNGWGLEDSGLMWQSSRVAVAMPYWPLAHQSSTKSYDQTWLAPVGSCDGVNGHHHFQGAPLKVRLEFGPRELP